MRWMNDLAAGSVAAGVLAAGAGATVSTTLVADAYIVTDGGRVYSVLDVYVRGNHLGDTMSTIIGGLNNSTNPSLAHHVVFATSQAQGVTRDASGKITATSGSITSDIFVQAGGSSWQPIYGGPEAWDSFVTLGARKQNAQIVNRAGVSVGSPNCPTYSHCIVPATEFTQFYIANSNFINNSGGSGWLTSLGSNPYLSGTNPSAAENPFARVSLYNSTWNSTYPTLDRSGVLNSKGSLFNGTATATGAVSATATGAAGSSLDFHWMVGRFVIDVTGRDPAQPITMQVQFNMVGKNGTGNEAGSIFTGASTSAYKVSQFFAFAPNPCVTPACPTDFDGNRVVDSADVALILLDFGACGGCPTDLDLNGVVDSADVSLILLDYGPCTGCPCTGGCA